MQNLKLQKDDTIINIKAFNRTGFSNWSQIFENALNSVYKNIYVPKGEYLIDCTQPIKLRNNSRLILASNAVLKAIPNNFTHSKIIEISNIENIIIHGENIQGDKLSHTGTKGEWGMSLEIKSSKNIILDNIMLKECWGDGIHWLIKTNARSKQKHPYNQLHL